MKRYNVHVCLNGVSVFVENWTRWCEIRPSATRTPKNVGRVRDLSNKIVKLPSECQKGWISARYIL